MTRHKLSRPKVLWALLGGFCMLILFTYGVVPLIAGRIRAPDPSAAALYPDGLWRSLYASGWNSRLEEGLLSGGGMSEGTYRHALRRQLVVVKEFLEEAAGDGSDWPGGGFFSDSAVIFAAPGSLDAHKLDEVLSDMRFEDRERLLEVVDRAPATIFAITSGSDGYVEFVMDEHIHVEGGFLYLRDGDLIRVRRDPLDSETLVISRKQ